MTVDQRKPENQWTGDERKAANLDQRLKSLIMFVLSDDQMNSVINYLTAKSTWDDLILYHEGPSDVKESRAIDLKLCYNTFKFKEGESLTQTFTRYKALMSELVNDGIKLSKLKINTGFINGLPKNKLKYEENLIDNIYGTEKNKSLVSATPLSTAFFSSSIVQDFQDSPDDEEDIRSSHEYQNDLEEEYQARALLIKSKRFFKKGTQRFSSAKATDQTECHKCGNKSHFARECWSKTSVSTYQSPFQPKPLSSSHHKPKLRHTKDFEAKYNKVKTKLALLSSSSSASNASMVKNKGLIAEAYEWDEEVSSDDNEMVEVKVLMALAEENDAVSKEGARNGEWVKISMTKVHTLLEMEDNDDRKVCLNYLCIDLNYVEEQRSNLLSKHRNLVHELNACKEELLVLKQAKLDFLTMQHVNTEILKWNKNLKTKLKELKAITETWLNSSNKVNQCISEQIPSQKKRIMGVDQLTKDPSSSGLKDLVFVKPSADDIKVTILGVERPWLSEVEGFILPNHDIGRILPSESQRNTTDPSVAVIDSSATDSDSADESSVCSAPLPPLKKLDGAEPISGPHTIKSSLRSKSTFKAEALKGVIINEPSLAPAKGNKSSSASIVHSAPTGKLKNVKIEDDPPLAIVECLQDLTSQDHKNASFHLAFTVVCDIRKPIWYLDSGCSRHMTGVKRYLHKYVEQPGPKVVFGDDSTCTTKCYGSIKCNDIVFIKFDEKRGTIFNSNKEIVMIDPRVRDVYVLDMPSSTQESCFFAKASENLNWLWHKRLAHLNFKTINKLEKHNLVIGLLSLIYSKDKPCSSCEKGKHHRASFETKQTSFIKKCLHLLHMDLFGPITPRSINHDKYTLVIVDEYSRYTWVYFLKKKSQAPQTIMSFIKSVENQNDIKVKQLRTDNGTEFRNSTLVNFCDEKGISQNFSSPYTPEQNGVAERKNRTLIESARTMLSGSIFSKQYWTEAVATACYTQNRSTIVKIHLKTPYEIFRTRILNISFLHVFGCQVYIHNHKDHLGKFDEKANDDYLLGYSLVSKAFRVFNTRRQQTEETYHITLDEIPEAIKFSKPSVDNINIAESERYPPDEYLHPYEPSQRYQTNNNDVSFIEPYECPKPVVLETKVSSDQNDQPVQNDEILNDDQSEHSNHTNDEQIIDSLPNTEDIHISEHLSSLNIKDTLAQNTTIPSPPLPVPSMVTLAPQDRWYQNKHIELVNIIGNPRAGMLTGAIAKQLSAASAYECLFVDFLSKEKPKKVFESLKHPGWVDVMQDELNQFARNKVWTLVPAPYDKTIIDSRWVFKNKRDETGIVIKNKTKLVAQGYNQQEGIDYDETFALVAILEDIRIFLAFATYMNFIVY
ncbi:retrovirus-related pol polyprotein from transposon TNT 1-94 [Tanacetum coccineum]